MNGREMAQKAQKSDRKFTRMKHLTADESAFANEQSNQ
jgi:hypothetical protein